MTATGQLKLAESEIKKAFRMFDKNGDGRITAQEICEVMQQLGEQLSDDDVKAMIAEADVNKDGVIDYSEFTRLLVSAFGGGGEEK